MARRLEPRRLGLKAGGWGSAGEASGMGSSAATAAGRRRASQRARRAAGTNRTPPRPRRKNAARPRRAPATASPRRRERLSIRGWLTVVAVTVLALTAGYFLWLRDSSLVAVTDVEVKGLSGPAATEIEADLTRAAKQMTTLHVDTAALEAAVAGQPTVASLRVDADFPKGLVVEVRERPPIALVSGGGREVAVAADGAVLNGIEIPDGLPRIRAEELPPHGALSGEPLEQALIVGAVPEALRRLIGGVSFSRELGVVVEMRGGIPIRFGTGARAADKWAAAAAVLADPKLETASYIDVRVPERPAAGGAASS